MNKQEFLNALKSKISGLSSEDIDERLNFYSEMIDDRIEDGKSEEDAIKEIGTPDEIASQIISETPLTKIVKHKVKSSHKPTALEITLIAIGFPVWLPLLIAAVAIIFSLYAVVWSLVVSLWAVCLAFTICSPAFLLAGFIALIMKHGVSAIIVIAGAFFIGGLAILLFFGCLASTKGVINLTKLIILSIKKCLVKGKEA